MKLSRKIRILTIVFTLITLFVVSGIIEYFGSNNYYNVESLFFHKEKKISYNFISDEYKDLEVLLVDWANWTNTYYFVNDNNNDYVVNNFGISTFEELNIDYVLIIDDYSNIKYSAHYHDDIVEEISSETYKIFSESGNKIGIVQIDDDYILLASKKINDSESTKKAKGMFFFGRKLDAQEFLRFDRNLGSKIQIYLGERVMSDYRYNYGLIGELHHKKKEDSYYEIVLPVMNKDKALYMRIELEDEISQLGDKYKNNYLVLAVIILVLFGVLLDQMFRFIVVKRIIRLNTEINSVFSEHNGLDRVTIENNYDEISQVGKNINALLDKIDIMNEELYNSATYDKMTGTYTRDAGIENLNRIILDRKIDNKILNIVYIDIDNLKDVNDTYGHSMGDELIISVVDIIKKSIDTNNFIVRLGGDEFLVVLSDNSNGSVKNVIQTIENNVEEYNRRNEFIFQVEMSLGSATYRENETVEQFIAEADKNMYEVKRKKKENL